MYRLARNLLLVLVGMAYGWAVSLTYDRLWLAGGYCVLVGAVAGLAVYWAREKKNV
jgi:hypothetical protein